ncbi:hypothetical protein [Aldersonia kunmingensis]|uniref:hypothetical protein n=1 Tax=Aldersonia kunmingensis TaxID=408066 RepID=UPI0012EDA6C3|nr:hypothetical protein [Aldersonia kunmingensis]
MPSSVEWVAAMLVLAKFAHVFVVAGLLVFAYRWSRRYAETSGDQHRRPPPKH